LEHPAKLKEMVDLWWEEAHKYGVLPLDDRDWERAAERLKMNPIAHYELHGDMARIDRLTAPDITDRSYRIKATFEGAHLSSLEGVILAWGSHFGGFVLFIKDDQLCYEYIYSESVTHSLKVDFRTTSDKTSIELRFKRQGKNAGAASLHVDGAELGMVAIPATWPTHGTTAGLNCGRDAGAPVSFSYQAPFCFNGTSLRAFIDLDMDGGTEPGALYAAILSEQ
jgi:arylsulfatase